MWKNNFQYFGSCFSVDDSLQITSNERSQVGSCWSRNKVNILEGFYCEFKFRLQSIGSQGADGIAFVLQNISNCYLGSAAEAGNGKGYIGIKSYLAIEFDTWSALPTHVCRIFLRTQGGPKRCIFTYSLPFLINNNKEHTVTINFNSTTKVLNLTVDTTSTFCYFDIVSSLGSIFYPGFTGATGAITQVQRITHFDFKEVAPKLTSTLATYFPKAKKKICKVKPSKKLNLTSKSDLFNKGRQNGIICVGILSNKNSVVLSQGATKTLGTFVYEFTSSIIEESVKLLESVGKNIITTKTIKMAFFLLSPHCIYSSVLKEIEFERKKQKPIILHNYLGFLLKQNQIDLKLLRSTPKLFGQILELVLEKLFTALTDLKSSIDPEEEEVSDIIISLVLRKNKSFGFGFLKNAILKGDFHDDCLELDFNNLNISEPTTNF